MKIPDNQAPPPAAAPVDATEGTDQTSQTSQSSQSAQNAGAAKQSAFASLLKKNKQSDGEAVQGLPANASDAGGKTGGEKGYAGSGAGLAGSLQQEGIPQGNKGNLSDASLAQGNLPGGMKGDGKTGEGGRTQFQQSGKHSGMQGLGNTGLPQFKSLGTLGGPKSASPLASTFSQHQTAPYTAKARETRTAEPLPAAPTVAPQGKPEPVAAPRTEVAGASEVKATGSTASVEQMQALANEMVDRIQSTTGAAGNDKVDIQFNSRTLEGLQVSISRNEGKVSVQFNTASEQVSQLLTQNVQSLTQAMAARGVDLAEVRVVPTTTNASETGNRSKQERDSRQGSRGGSGGQGGGQRGDR